MENTLIFKRKDLNLFRRLVSFSSMTILHMPVSFPNLSNAEIVMFVDEDGSTKILKNRFGATGIVKPELN